MTGQNLGPTPNRAQVTDPDLAAKLDALAQDDDAIHAAHKKLEDLLVELRDLRTSVPTRGNGMVIREANGEPSEIIRLSTPDAVRVALRGVASYLRGE